MSGFVEFRARLAQDAAKMAGNVAQMVQPVTNEFSEIVLAGYNWLGRFISIGEANPLSQQYVEQELANALSLAAGTTYYPSSAGASMGGYKDLGSDILLATTGAGDSITVTIETTDDTTNPPAAGSWVDITMAGYDLGTNAYGAASFAASGAAGALNKIVDWDNLNSRRFRFKVVVVKAVNNSTLSLWIRQKAL